MFYEIYDLLMLHIYGNPEVITADMTLVLTLCSTIGALFVVAVPFMIVWRIIKVLMA